MSALKSEQTNPTAPPKLYLDILPPEVQHRILLYLAPDPSDPDSTYHYLFLGEASPTLLPVIRQLLCSKLSITRHMLLVDRWAALLYPILQHLDIRVNPKSVSPSLHALLTAPNLTHLSFTPTRRMLRALHGAPALRNLSIVCFTRSDVPTMFESIMSIPHLETLKLKLAGSINPCLRAKTPYTCPLASLEGHAFPHARQSLNVTELDIQCLCPHFERCMIWRFALNSPKLRRLTLHQTTYGWHWGYSDNPLDEKSSIVLLPRIERQATHLSVTFIQNLFTWNVRFDDSWKSRTPSIFSLSMGTMSDFASTAFVSSDKRAIFPTSVARLKSFEIQNPRHSSYYEGLSLATGSILRSIQAMPMLSELHLQGTIVRKSELRSILEEMGTRLTKCVISIEWQRESAHRRLIFLLDMLRTFNPSIRELGFDCEKIIYSQCRVAMDDSEQLLQQDMLRAAYDNFCFSCRFAQIKDTSKGHLLSYKELEETVFNYGEYDGYGDGYSD